MKSSKDNLTKEQRKELKRRNKEQKLVSELSSISKNDSFITILCVRFGTKYGSHYVERLRNMIQRNISIPYELVCLTDDPKPIEGVRSIVRKNEGYVKGWWHKVHMFDPSLPLNGRILYMDLDVVICGNIDKIALLQRSDFLGIRDFNRKFHSSWKRLNSSVMAWNHGTQKHIWEEFRANPQQAMRMHGDQDWIWKTSSDRLRFFPDLWIQSYKWEVRSRDSLIVVHGKRQFKEIDNKVRPHPDCSIAVFHGDPNPCEVQDQFVIDNWK